MLIPRFVYEIIIMSEYDIAIIGGGILAYSTAYEIVSQSPNCKLAIISGKSKKGMSTAASGAMLGCYGEINKHSLQSNAGKIKHEMGMLATRMWPAWLASIKEAMRDNLDGAQNLEIRPGTFIISNEKSLTHEKENFSAMIKALKLHREPYWKVTSSDIPGFYPKVGFPLVEAIYLPNEGSIDPNYLLFCLKRIAALAKNCSDLDQDVVDFHINTSCCIHVKTNSGTLIKAKKFLIAAGAHSHQLINKIPALRHRIPPIFSGFGVSLLLEQLDLPVIATIRTPNRAGACGLHLLPRGEKSLYLGASNHIYFTPKHKPKLNYLWRVLQSGVEQINHYLSETRIIKYVVGNRPVPIDSFPLIGKTSIENLSILSGTFREGIHLAPLLSKIISAELLNNGNHIPAINTRIFAPERFPIQTMKKEVAITEAVFQYMSSSYEHGMSLPTTAMNNMLEEILYHKISGLYDMLGSDLIIPPEIVVALAEKKIEDFLKEYLEFLHLNAKSLKIK